MVKGLGFGWRGEEFLLAHQHVQAENANTTKKRNPIHDVVVEGDDADSQELAAREVFDKFDADDSGSIGIAELRAMLNLLGLHPSEEELERSIRAVDPDGSGEVSLLINPTSAS